VANRESWRDPWPCKTVVPGKPQPSPGVELLQADGYRYVADVLTLPTDIDRHQHHLNNAAIPRICNEVRIGYVATLLAPDWPNYMARHSGAVVVRAFHALYETEGFEADSYVASCRVTARQGRAVIQEQRVVTAADARPIARVWLVHLYLENGAVSDFPPAYWEATAAAERHPIPVWTPPAPRPPWGPTGEV
jgi:acyl-CoA thioesterase FadM